MSRRRVEQLWHAHRRTGILPTLKLGRPSKASVSLRDAAPILEAYDKVKVNALTLERVLNDAYRVRLPHNRIHMILKEAVEGCLNSRTHDPRPEASHRQAWMPT